MIPKLTAEQRLLLSAIALGARVYDMRPELDVFHWGLGGRNVTVAARYLRDRGLVKAPLHSANAAELVITEKGREALR